MRRATVTADGTTTNRAELSTRMRIARAGLKQAVADCRPGTDAGGWSAADHLAHVLAWEGALVAVLSGGSTPGALGYSREEYEQLDTDALNQQLVERFRDSPEALLERLDSVRSQLEAALSSMSDSDLERRFEDVRHWEAPDEPQWTVWDWLLSYAPAHDEEHARYIEILRETE